MTMQKRKLGESGIEVSALGLGCMRLAGKGWFRPDGQELDMGPSDDKESIRAINEAIDRGCTLFDTADIYGAGSNEELLGKAITGRRDEVTVVTKGGFAFDEESRTLLGRYIEPTTIKAACEGSLRRLGIDRIDLYLLHSKNVDADYDLDAAATIRDGMEELVAEGKIRCYGWSTDFPHQLEVFLKGEHCVADELDFNIFMGNEETLQMAETNGLAALIRRPLACGALSENPRKGAGTAASGGGEENRRKLEALREILTSSGRSLVQGALAWLWARSSIAIPIPGFRSFEQMEGLVGAMKFGPLTPEQMAEIENISKL
jgi:aryl-alcohol dehydrogenase-like predicted oxidoreductase